jgi:hypothetical protein
MKPSICIQVLLMILVLPGCVLLGPVAGSRSYTPHSDQEKAEFEKADRGIYPDDIRRDASKLRTTTIAWPGIIRETSFVEEDDHVQMFLFVEHHYYDWIQDFGTYHGTYWLSPRGEGVFKTGIRFDKADLAKRKKWGSVGNMVIVYGTPGMVDTENIVYINATYIVFLGGNYNTYKLDYGRPEHRF